MRNSSLFFLILRVAVCIKLSQNTLGKAFISTSHVNAVAVNNTAPSVKNLNEYTQGSHNRLQPLADVSSNPYNFDQLTHPSTNSYKLRGVELSDKVVPVNDYVLVVKKELTQQTKSGVYLGSNTRNECVGTVLAVGPGKLNKSSGVVTPPNVVAGDTVLFVPPESRVDLKYNNKDCLLLRNDDILARITVPKDPLDDRLTTESIVPLGDRLMVRIYDTPRRTESGLVIAKSNTKDDLVKVKVMAIGTGSYTEDGRLVPISGFNVGDFVLCSEKSYNATQYSSDNVNYAFVNREGVFAIV